MPSQYFLNYLLSEFWLAEAAAVAAMWTGPLFWDPKDRPLFAVISVKMMSSAAPSCLAYEIYASSSHSEKMGAAVFHISLSIEKLLLSFKWM